LWDIRGKALNLPLWKLLGGARERVPTYASGALMRGLSLDRVVSAAARLKERGFSEMKTAGAARRDHTRQGGRTRAASARGDRARHQADV
jgi:L-alanine-DL-glutamate epimerase-like enolase superfamily enzyme